LHGKVVPALRLTEPGTGATAKARRAARQSNADTDRAMKIIRAEHMGMCFGVRDAIALAREITRESSLTILGDLVHNETVLNQLREQGVRIENQVEAIATRTVMITAHGASHRRRNWLNARGHEVIEATCPLVRQAHRAVQQMAQQDYHPVIVGVRDHVEVRGLTEDLEDYDVVLSEADVLQLSEHARFGIAAQTTQPIERVRALVGLMQRRFPNAQVRFIDTVCQPTKQRQFAAADLAQQCDAVVVIGGTHSNNTRELVATCLRHCHRVYHVQGTADLHADWFHESDTVGLTAGTSTPDNIIDEVHDRLQALTERLHPTPDQHPAFA
jgi:4-hydroxy-3-methylbut-2-enyl diphosphate reductase